MGEESGRAAADHVDVGCFDVVRVEEAHDAGYVAAPVAALGDVARVAKLEHEFVACFGVLGEGETAFCDAGGEAEVWMGRGNDVKRRGCGGCEEGEDFLDLEEGAGPCDGRELEVCVIGAWRLGVGDLQPWAKRRGIAPSIGDFW